MYVYFSSQDFFEKLLVLKKRFQLSKGEFCKKIGVRNAFVAYDPKKPDPRTGKPRTPSMETLFRIANEFDVEVAWLLNLQDKEPASFRGPDPKTARYLDMAQKVLEHGDKRETKHLKLTLELCYERISSLPKEEPTANTRETNPAARRRRRAAGGA